MSNTTATIIFVRGLPGSGKTFLAAALSDALHRERAMRPVMLDPDATDYDSPEYAGHVAQLTAEGVDPKLFAYRFLRGKAFRAIEMGGLAVWNQPFTNLEIFDKMMAKLREHAAAHDVELQVLIVEVMVDPAVAKDRVMQRKAQGGHGPSDATFERFTRDYFSFAPHGYTTVTVQGDADVRHSVATVIKALDSLGQAA